jgi:GH35 family endo-1,4-beta-xylanase
MIAHSGDAKKAESGKLRRASSKRRQVGRKIEGVGVQSFLEIEGESVEKLGDKIQTPQGDFRG